MSWFDAFLLATVVQFVFGLAITGLSYSAYLSSDGLSTFLNSTLGFLFITVGGVLAPIYQLGIERDYNISAQELLKLQIIEGSLIAIGLALLVFAVLSHSQTSNRVRVDPNGHDVRRKD